MYEEIDSIYEDTDSIKNRLIMFIDYMGMSKYSFEKKCGLSTRYVSNIGRTIGIDALLKIQKAFPELNQIWLTTGIGTMMRESSRNNEKSERIPIVPAEAHGGSLAGYSTEGATLTQCEMISAPIPATLAIRVTGDSMSPEYPSGSLVFVRKINEAIMIEYGCCYVLDTTEGVVIKEIHKSDRDGYVTCVSINPDPKFATFDLSMDYIRGWYKVLMVMAMK